MKKLFYLLILAFCLPSLSQEPSSAGLNEKDKDHAVEKNDTTPMIFKKILVGETMIGDFKDYLDDIPYCHLNVAVISSSRQIIELENCFPLPKNATVQIPIGTDGYIKQVEVKPDWRIKGTEDLYITILSKKYGEPEVKNPKAKKNEQTLEWFAGKMKIRYDRSQSSITYTRIDQKELDKKHKEDLEQTLLSNAESYL